MNVGVESLLQNTEIKYYR